MTENNRLEIAAPAIEMKIITFNKTRIDSTSIPNTFNCLELAVCVFVVDMID